MAQYMATAPDRWSGAVAVGGGHTGRTYRSHPTGGSPSHPAPFCWTLPDEISTIRACRAAIKSGHLPAGTY